MRFTPQICESIGRQLRDTRKGKHDTQRELAGILGVSRRMVMKYEQGKVAPTGEALTRAANYAGGLDLPGYDYKLTTEALRRPGAPPATTTSQQMDLPFGVPQEFCGATVRVTRSETSIEILAVLGGPDRR
jgi:transcriptional regulator with XRE-family HTH domain